MDPPLAKKATMPSPLWQTTLRLLSLNLGITTMCTLTTKLMPLRLDSGTGLALGSVVPKKVPFRPLYIVLKAPRSLRLLVERKAQSQGLHLVRRLLECIETVSVSMEGTLEEASSVPMSI